jgi:hypothetical protein
MYHFNREADENRNIIDLMNKCKSHTDSFLHGTRTLQYLAGIILNYFHHVVVCIVSMHFIFILSYFKSNANYDNTLYYIIHYYIKTYSEDEESSRRRSNLSETP